MAARARPPQVSTPARAVPRTAAQRLRPTPGLGVPRYLKSVLFPKVKTLVSEYRRLQGCPSPAVDEQIRFVREQYLPYLEFDVAGKMTEESAKFGKVKEALLLLRNTDNGLPRDITKKADELYKTFDGLGWKAAARTPAPQPGPSFTNDRYPPDDHPIWGIDGIMHGAVLGRGSRGQPTYKLDDRFTPREAKVYGHNGLRPGSWFARQECLRFHGGHAQRIRGISGHVDQGAYSIVVSGEYGDTDKDEGDVLYYSAEGAHDDNPSEKAGVKGNLALRASMVTRNPVRVFRSAKAGGRFAPPCGIRYDGLYEVVGKEYRRNGKGHYHQLFKLRRRDGQPDLEDIMNASPTRQQQADFAMIRAGY